MQCSGINKFSINFACEPEQSCFCDGAVTLRVTHGDNDAVEISVALQNEPIVILAEPDLATEGELKHFSIPNDAYLAKQWHLQNVGQVGGGSSALKPGADARVVAAWLGMKSLGSPEVAIGIIDDGFDLTHPDLASRIVHPWDFKRGFARSNSKLRK